MVCSARSTLALVAGGPVIFALYSLGPAADVLDASGAPWRRIWGEESWQNNTQKSKFLREAGEDVAHISAKLAAAKQDRARARAQAIRGPAPEAAPRPGKRPATLSEAATAETVECSVTPPVDSKVIVHSMPKSGTSTIGQALTKLGYRDCEWMPEIWERHLPQIEQANKLVRGLPFDRIPDEVSRGVSDLMARFQADLDHCDSAGDFPMGHYQVDLRVKRILWPTARFIWLDRNMDQWLDSSWRWDHRANKTFDSHDPADAEVRAAYFEKMRELREGVKRDILALKEVSPASVLITEPAAGWEDLLGFLFGEGRACGVSAPWPHDVPH